MTQKKELFSVKRLSRKELKTLSFELIQGKVWMANDSGTTTFMVGLYFEKVKFPKNPDDWMVLNTSDQMSGIAVNGQLHSFSFRFVHKHDYQKAWDLQYRLRYGWMEYFRMMYGRGKSKGKPTWHKTVAPLK